MLKNHIRSQDELAKYMRELKDWLRQERSKPIETMISFFLRDWITMKMFILVNGH